MNLPVAHIDAAGREHLLVDHLREVGELAARFGEKLGAAEVARLAGAWHDLGKLSGDFQRYIRAANGQEAHVEDGDVSGPAKRVDHSTAGALHAIRSLPDPVGQVLAFIIAGHHAGLADLEQLKGRLASKRDLLDLALRGLGDLSLARPGVATSIPFAVDSAPSKRRLEMWIRMLFSALCDADFLDTERFFRPAAPELRAVDVELSTLANALSASLDERQADASDTAVNRARADVRRACLERAADPPGFFSLTVPTGGGKTLASMAFALEHARAHGLERVVVAIPFTSIIEQSADVFRGAFATLGARVVLEHHASLDPNEESAWNRVACENWDAPVVVTTTAQLFDSLFANRTSACRKLHRLARSVVILDEAQTLPPRLLRPILDALGELVATYGSSVIICTATQPALGRTVSLPEGFERVTEIAPADLLLFETLRRVRVSWPDARVTPYAELAGEVARRADVLAIVHRRDDARSLTELIDQEVGAADTVHLSALMCAAHRSHVLKDLIERRRRGEPVRVVSTQLVEAGVDVDFPVVYRALAGAEAIAQSAGRCNREGRLAALGELVVFRAETEPPRGVLLMGKQLFDGMLAQDPDLDAFAPETFRRYFRDLYALGAVDEGKTIQDHRAELRFQTTAKEFKLIEDDWSLPVVVPYRTADGAHPAEDALEALEREGPTRRTLRRLQRFTIAVPKAMRDRWMAIGLAREVCETVVALGAGAAHAYSPRFGLVVGDIDRPPPEVLVV